MLSKAHTKYIQSLVHKKFRDQTNLFLAETPKIVGDLLNSQNFKCKEIFALQQWIDNQEKMLSGLFDVLICPVKDFELKKISALTSPHDVVATFEKREMKDNISLKNKITIALDGLQDPGNLGTIIRIADWFGIENIVCGFGTADIYNPKVVQSTMGSLGRVNVVYADLPEWLIRNKTVKIFTASMAGKNIKHAGSVSEGIIIIGNEAKGITKAVEELADEKLNIPRIGKAESLNAAVAAGIILSQIK